MVYHEDETNDKRWCIMSNTKTTLMTVDDVVISHLKALRL